MTTASTPLTHPLVLGDIFPVVRGRNVLLITGGVLLMALLAQVAVPVPGSPVPITGQTLGVILTAAALGPIRGTLVQVSYILAGAVGLPFYSEASRGVEVVVGATGGYLIGFIPAAYLIGLATRRGTDRRFVTALPLLVAGQAVIFAIGVPWLATVSGMGPGQALEAGFYPFILGGIVKAAIAAAVLCGTWLAVKRRLG